MLISYIHIICNELQTQLLYIYSGILHSHHVKLEGMTSLLVVGPLYRVQPSKVARLFIRLTWWSNPLPDQHFTGWGRSLPATPRPGLKLLIWLFKITLNPKQVWLQTSISFSNHVRKGRLSRWITKILLNDPSIKYLQVYKHGTLSSHACLSHACVRISCHNQKSYRQKV